MGKIQFPLSAQCVPAFLYGLFTTRTRFDMHPWSIAIGAWVAVVYVLGFYFGYLDKVEGAKPVNAGISGLMVNVVITLSTEAARRALNGETVSQGEHKVTSAEDEEKDHTALLLFAERPDWDIPALSRFGDHALSPELIWKSMKGIPEPMTNIWWVAFFFTVITLATPLTPENEPPLMDGGAFLWAPALVRGLPWWYLKMLIISALSTVILIGAISNAPDEFPKVRGDELVMKRRGTDNVSFAPEYDGEDFPPPVVEESFDFDSGEEHEEEGNREPTVSFGEEAA